MSKDIVSYLFGESQLEAQRDDVREHIEEIMEEAEAETPINAKKTPLATALKSLGIDVGDGLEMDPEGFSISFDNDQEYHVMSEKVSDPDAMEKLAELGWVAHKLGDSAMMNEVPEYRIRFIDIATAETTDADKPSQSLKDIMKQGREFATTPMDHDDPNNPVEWPEAPNKKHAGMSDATDGGKADHAIHGGKSKSEALEVVEQLVEGGHRAGCKCGFCANKGKFGKKKDAAETAKETPEEETEVEAETGIEAATEPKEESVEPARYDEAKAPKGKVIGKAPGKIVNKKRKK